MSSSTDTTAQLLTLMSQRLMHVAQLNTALDQFGSSRALPAQGQPAIQFVNAEKLLEKTLETVGWKFAFNTLITNSDWVSFLDLGGFDFEDAPGPLETRHLTTEERRELEKLELF